MSPARKALLLLGVVVGVVVVAACLLAGLYILIRAVALRGS